MRSQGILSAIKMLKQSYKDDLKNWMNRMNKKEGA
jgi:hypothetical protein